jgi:hypothetical protein
MNIKEKEISLLKNDDKYKKFLIKDFKKIQKSNSLCILKNFIKNLIPLEFKLFYEKFIKLNDLSNYNNLNELISKIDENVMILNNVYNPTNSFNGFNLKVFSFQKKIFKFLDKLKS